MSLIERALRIGEGKKFKEFERRVARINDWEAEIELDSDEELRARADALRERARGGEGVHIVTVNDYLARRDAEWMRPVYEALGVSVGVVQSGEMDELKHEAYAADITYGTNSEFGFDYLRDNLAMSIEDKYQRGHGYAIVDEVDNILIDEARTPLIISGQPEQAADLYYKFAQLARRLQPGKKPEGPEGKSKDYVADFDFEPDEKHNPVAVTE